MTFIKDLPWASKLSVRFRDALEEFLPEWIESLLPYYREGKERGVDMFWLCNYIPTNTPTEETLYEHHGISYYQHHWPSSPVRILGFNSKSSYRPCNWMECLIKEKLPDYNTASREDMDNHWHYNYSMNRLYNTKPEYSQVAERCNQYFHEITGDTTAGFSLSRGSGIYYNDKARWYINEYHRHD